MRSRKYETEYSTWNRPWQGRISRTFIKKRIFAIGSGKSKEKGKMNLRNWFHLCFSFSLPFWFPFFSGFIPTFRFEKGKGNGEPTGSSFLCTGRMGEIQVEITRPSIGRLGRKVEAAGNNIFWVIDWLLHFQNKMEKIRKDWFKGKTSFPSEVTCQLILRRRCCLHSSVKRQASAWHCCDMGLTTCPFSKGSDLRDYITCLFSFFFL